MVVETTHCALAAVLQATFSHHASVFSRSHRLMFFDQHVATLSAGAVKTAVVLSNSVLCTYCDSLFHLSIYN